MVTKSLIVSLSDLDFSLIIFLSRQTPVANRELPSQALAGRGYGGIPVASSANKSWKTLDPVFHLEFSLPENTSAVGIGGRAFITLAHEPESIGKRSWRALRRVLIDQLAL